jgi:hypothetical protein
MAQEDPIRFFRVVVGTEISVFRDSGPGIPNLPVEVEDLRLKTIQVLAAMLREGRLINEEEYKVLGSHLYEILFHNQIGTAITDTYKEPHQFMRVELEFQKGRELLSSLPWELLYCPAEYGQEGTGYFLADLPRLILTRRLTLKGRELCIEKPPLKVLFVASGPTGHEVEYEKVLESIENLPGGMVEVQSLLPGERSDKKPSQLATWEKFEIALQVYGPDVIHFLGHGRWDDKRKAGTILFMKEGKDEDPRSESELGAIKRLSRAQTN